MQPYTPEFLCDQANRTAPTRQFFYQQIRWTNAPICLDVGCGAGHITPEMANSISHSTVIGFDIDQELIHIAISSSNDNQNIHYLLADATTLPFKTTIVNFAISHFTLMWIPERLKALEELQEVLSSQGTLACIEPDYAGRIEIYEPGAGSTPKPPYPIVTTLTRLGADPFTGGRLPGELLQLMFKAIRFGILSWNFDPQAIRAEIQSEAVMLQEKGVEWVLPEIIYTPIFWILALKPL
ncbi:MAG: class I SAM-dependent methyltransferase [Promethearchaeota archaeon]